MERNNIDWSNLGFGYIQTELRYVSNYKDGQWDQGGLTKDATVTMNECAGVLQYAQTCFEGLKAYTTADGRIVCFRPDLNAARMIDSCLQLKMPPFPEERFLDAVRQTVKANAHWVPPYGSGASLYIRPYMFGSNPVIGVKPATEYQFRLFVTPVGPYFKGGVKPLTVRISDLDRAAPRGTGHIKAGLNYAMSLYNIVDAHEQGYDENIYVDSATRTYIEETGGANIIFITKDGKLVTPKSDTILPSITRRSIVQVAKDYLGMEVEERPVALSEIDQFAECGLCGTAAVISPVGKIVDHGREIIFPSGMNDMGPVTKKLYDTLRDIQMGKITSPDGWIMEIL
ncbi:MAG: branched-chain amino acid aminotransferase [Oscillospiraceae bacterium]|nr:branched-chain amino acid aminotransferase [Oscillospiraceae bacterium]